MRPKVSITGNITAQKGQTTAALDGSGAPTAPNQEVTPPPKKKKKDREIWEQKRQITFAIIQISLQAGNNQNKENNVFRGKSSPFFVWSRQRESDVGNRPR